MKLSKFRQLTQKIENLSKEILKHEPPKPYIMVWSNKLVCDYGWRVERFYTEEDMKQTMHFIIGSSNPKNYTFFLTKEINP